MGRVAAGVAASAAAEYGSAEAAQQRIGLSNPHQGAQPDEPGTRPAHVAGFSCLAREVGELPSCAAPCQAQPQARIDASPGLQCVQKDGTPFASSSGALHRSMDTAHQRPHKPPQRPAMAVHHLDLLRRLWPVLARLKGIAAGCPPTPEARTFRRLRCNQDGKPSTSTERPSSRPAPARPAAWC